MRFNDQGTKNSAHADFEEVLDLSEYVVNEKTAVFQLKAVIQHIGEHYHKGHYISYCKSDMSDGGRGR